MKYFSFLLSVLFYISSFGQKVYSTKKDISDAKQITFFGYDFSHFKLAEAKRLNENEKISVYPPAWVGYLNKLKDEAYYAEKLKTKKVIFDFEHTAEVMKNLKDDELISLLKNVIPPDSIQNIINRFQFKEKEGIGFLIIVECFEKRTKTSSAYFTFFDIATKKIIMSNNYATSFASGIGLTSFWGFGFNETIFTYLNERYKKDLKKK